MAVQGQPVWEQEEDSVAYRSREGAQELEGLALIGVLGLGDLVSLHGPAGGIGDEQPVLAIDYDTARDGKIARTHAAVDLEQELAVLLEGLHAAVVAVRDLYTPLLLHTHYL